MCFVGPTTTTTTTAADDGDGNVNDDDDIFLYISFATFKHKTGVVVASCFFRQVIVAYGEVIHGRVVRAGVS